MITLKKVRESSRAYGRGMDNYYTPAQYGVFSYKHEVARIYGKPMRYMDPADWQVWIYATRVAYNFTSYKNAKEFALKYVREHEAELLQKIINAETI